MSRFTKSSAVAATLLLAACSDSGVGPDDPDPLEPSVQIEEEALGLHAIGEEQALTVLLEGGASGPLVWTSSDTDVATVSIDGRVTAVGNGVARIDVTAAGGEGDALDVTVDAETWRSVSAGEDFACGLAADGRAFCWGDNGSGQGGNGSELFQVPEPIPVSGDLRFSMIDSGEDHACAVTVDGEIYCWGQNQLGELGVGDDRAEARVPAPVASTLSFTRVSAGFISTCAIDTDGQAHCWGDNRSGQLGDGTAEERRAPVPVSSSLRFTEIDVGAFHTCAVDEDGGAHCWGGNVVGQLGSGTTTSSPEPVAVEGDRIFTTIAVGLDHACAVEATGDVYCWGLNNGRQLGTATGECNPMEPLDCSAVPVRVPLEASAESVAVGGFTPAFACAVTDAGTWCWGAGRDAPLRIDGEGLEFRAVAAGLEDSYGIDADGLLFRWDGGDVGLITGPMYARMPDRRVEAAAGTDGGPFEP